MATNDLDNRMASAEARMDNILAAAEPMFQRLDRMIERLDSDTGISPVSRSPYISKTLMPDQLKLYSDRREARRIYAQQYEDNRRLLGGWDGQLTPYEEIEIEQKVDAQYPIDDEQKETEFKLRGDPNWQKYDPKVELKGAGWWSLPGQLATVGQVNLINRSLDSLPETARDSVLGVLNSVQSGFVSSLGYMADTAQALTYYPMGLFLVDNFTDAGNGGIIYTARKSLQNTMMDVREHYFQDFRSNVADPNRTLGRVADADGVVRWEWDDKEFGPSAWYSPVSISQFAGNLTGQFMALGLVGKVAGASQGLSTVDPVKAVRSVQNSTAAALTAIGMGQVGEGARLAYEQMGYTPQQAQARADMTAALYAPVGFLMSKIDPQTQLLAKGTIAGFNPTGKISANFLPMVFRGAFVDGFSNFGDEAWRQVLYNTTVTGTWSKQAVWNSVQETLIAGGLGMASGAFFGGLGAIELSRQGTVGDRAALLAALEKDGIDPDATDMKSFYGMLTSGAWSVKVKKEQALAVTVFTDNLIRRFAKRNNVGYRDAWAMVLANKSLMDLTTDDVLFQEAGEFFQHRYKTEDAINSPEFYKAFNKKTDINQVYGWLTNKVGKRSLISSGLEEWYLQNKELDEQGNVKKVDVNDMKAALKEKLLKFDTMRTMDPDLMQEKKILDQEGEDLRQRLHDLYDKMSKAKPEEVSVLDMQLMATKKLLDQKNARLREIIQNPAQINPTYKQWANVDRPGVVGYFEFIVRFPVGEFLGVSTSEMNKGHEFKRTPRIVGGEVQSTVNPYMWIRGTEELVDGKRTMVVQELQGDFEQQRGGLGAINDPESLVSKAPEIFRGLAEDSAGVDEYWKFRNDTFVAASELYASDPKKYRAFVEEKTLEFLTNWLVRRGTKESDAKKLVKNVDPDHSRPLGITGRKNLVALIGEYIKEGGLPATPTMSNWQEVMLKMILLEAGKRKMERIALPSGEFVGTLGMDTHSEKDAQGRAKNYDVVLVNQMNDILGKIVKGSRLVESRLSPTTVYENKMLRASREAWDKVLDEFEALRHRAIDVLPPTDDSGQLVFRADLQANAVSVKKLIDAVAGVDGLPAYNLLNDLDNIFTRVWWQGGGPGPKVYSFDFTPEFIDKLSQGLPLYQENKASVSFLRDARAIIKALSNPDVSSIVHEVGHIARRQFLDPRDRAALERMFGVDNGVWTKEQEEAFARTFEAFFRGKIGYETIKDPRTIEVFNTLQDHMREVYKQAKDIKGAKEINTEFEGIIRRMFVDETNEMMYREQQVILLEEQRDQQLKRFNKEVDKLKKKLKPDGSVDEKAQARIAEMQNVNARVEKDLRDARKILQDLVEREFHPTKNSLAQQRADKYWHVEQLAQKEREHRQSFFDSHFIRWARGLYDVSRIMHSTDAARLFRAAMDDMIAEYSAAGGPYLRALSAVLFDGLSVSQRRELGRVDPKTGMSNWRRMFDEKGVPEDLKLQSPDWAGETMRLFRAINDMITARMEAAEGFRRMPKGDTVKFQESFHRTPPRILTGEGYAKIQEKGSEEYRALIKGIKELNPGLTDKDIAKWERDELGSQRGGNFIFGRAVTRRQGFVEGSRKVRYIPDSAILPNGQQFNFFHTDPFEVGMRWIENGLRRIAIIKTLGQGMLKDVSGVRKYMHDILSLIGKAPKPLNRDEIVNQIMAHKLVSDRALLSKMTVKQLKKIAKDNGIDVGVTHEEYLAKFNRLSWRDFNEHQYSPDEKANVQLKRQAHARIIKIARKIGGVDTSGHLGEILSDLKQRMNEKIMDDVYDKLRTAHYKQGGTVADMDRVWHLFQGRPLYVPDVTAAGRFAKLASTIVESSLTSLNTLSNIFQFLIATNEARGGRIVTIPTVLKDTVKAFYKLASDYDSVLNYGVDIGAMKPTVNRFTSDNSYRMSRASQFIRTTAGQLFLSTRTTEFLNVLSLRLGQQMMDRWLSPGGFKIDRDAPAARRLRLSESEIAEIAVGRVGPDNIIYKKALQNFIKLTQGVSEGQHRKGYIEVNPWLKMVFSFSSYMNLQNRRAEATFDEMRTAYKEFKETKSKAGAIKLATRTAAVMAGLGFAIGAGELNRLLKDAVHQRQPNRDDEEWWQRVKNDLVEYQFIGHAARFVNLSEYPQSIAQPLLAQSPLITTVSEFLTAAYGGGRYSRYPFWQRYGKTYLDLLPAYKVSDRAREYANYPDREVNDRLRQDVTQWTKRQPWYVPEANEYARDPLTYEIYEHVARGDWENARKAVAAYVKNAPEIYRAEGKDPSRIMSNLRQSLLARRPMNLNDTRRLQFLRSLPEEKRHQYVKANMKYIATVNMIAPSFD